MNASERDMQKKSEGSQASDPIPDGRVDNAMADGSRDTAAEKHNKPDDANDEKVTRLGTASIWKLLIEFAIPAVIGTLVNAAYNLISTVFLGSTMGSIGIAAMQVAAPIMIVFLAFAMLIGSGGNALAALLLGEGEHERAEQTLGNTVSLSIVLATAIAIASLTPGFMNFILDLSSATPDVRPYAEQYIRIICLGYIFQCIGFGVNNFIRTAGKPNRALVTMVVGAVSCIIFNFIFVFNLKWGVFGCGLSTVLGQAVSCASVLQFFIFSKETPLRLRLRNMKFIPRLDGRILVLGTASFFVQLGSAILTTATNMLLVKYGALHPIGEDAALASIGLVQRVIMLAFTPLIGISIAAQPILGFNYGAKNFGRVRATLLRAIALATIIAVVMWVLINVFARPIVNVFGITDEALVDFTIFALQIQMLMFPFVGFQVVGSNYFQATGQPAKSILLSLSRQVLFLLPLMVFLPEWLPTWTSFTGLDAIYIATPVSDCLAILLTLVFVLVELRRLRRIEHHEPAPQY